MKHQVFDIVGMSEENRNDAHQCLNKSLKVVHELQCIWVLGYCQ